MDRKSELLELLQRSKRSVPRILVVDTISYRPHLETAIEMALVSRYAGAEVHYLNLRSILPRVEDQNMFPRTLDVRAARVARAEKFLAAERVNIIKPNLALSEMHRAMASAREMLLACTDQKSVSLLRYKAFHDIGWGLLSSVIEVTKNPNVSMRTQKRLLREFLASSILVYETVCALILQLRPEAVVLFNGRFATTRAVLRAAEDCGTKPLIHERGCDKDHYWIATEPIHDPDYVQKCIRAFWHPALLESGGEFFQGRRGRVEKSWFSFTKLQVVGKLPVALTENFRWAVFFTASEDEYAAIGDKYKNPAFPTQIDAIHAVYNVVRELPEYRFCIRVHPNVRNSCKEQIAFWKYLSLPGAVVVSADEDCDSYAILDRAHVVCTYGSTMGIEATYWGKPSLLLSRSIYDRLGVAFSATNSNEIRDFLLTPKVYPRAAALKYGAFFSRFGTRFKYFQANDLFSGAILGHRMDMWLVYFWRSTRARVKKWIFLRGGAPR